MYIWSPFRCHNLHHVPESLSLQQSLLLCVCVGNTRKQHTRSFSWQIKSRLRESPVTGAAVLLSCLCTTEQIVFTSCKLYCWYLCLYVCVCVCSISKATEELIMKISASFHIAVTGCVLSFHNHDGSRRMIHAVKRKQNARKASG